MKTPLIYLWMLIAQVSFANESSVQWYIQPLKIKHRVGKDTMTDVALYRFPLFMRYTHPTIMLNYIATENRLEELTVVADKSNLKDVNLAHMYGVKVFYDIVEDSTKIDLTQVKKPAGEAFSVDEVIAMTLECIRLSGSGSRTTIITNESTKKWQAYEKGFRERSHQNPLYVVKSVPLKVAEADKLYHWAYISYDDPERPPGFIRFPFYGGEPEDNDGSDTSYLGMGLSKKLRVRYVGDVERDVELNPLAGYTLLKKDGILTIKAPNLSQADKTGDAGEIALTQMRSAIKYVRLAAESMGDSDKDYRLQLIDTRLSKTQREVLLKQVKQEN